MKFVSFGEIIWDIYGKERKIGGAPLNISAHASLYGFDSYLISAVGNDALGEEAFGKLKDLEVNTKYVKANDELPTGQCIVSLDKNGIPDYNILSEAAYDLINAPDEALHDFDVLSFGTLALRYEHNVKSLTEIIKRNTFGEIYADLNIRPPFYSEESVCFCLENASIVKISEEELPLVTKLLSVEYDSPRDAAGQIAALYSNIKLLIITLGEKGSFCVDSMNKETYFADKISANVKSTVGAGDSFGAAFLASYLKNPDIPGALNAAAHVSAYVVSSIEAIPLGSREVFERIKHYKLIP